MKNREKNSELLERNAIIVLAYLFKSIRYVFRLAFKLIRLIYRMFKKLVQFSYEKIEPIYSKVTEKLYVLACKTFDVN